MLEARSSAAGAELQSIEEDLKVLNERMSREQNEMDRLNENAS